MKEIETQQAGKYITSDVLINQIECEIKRIYVSQDPGCFLLSDLLKDKSAFDFNSKEVLKQLEEKKERLIQVGLIIERAKNNYSTQLSKDQLELINKIKVEEMENEECKLKTYRKLYESVKPCLR